MTEADRAQLMAAYAELSKELQFHMDQEFSYNEKTRLEYEKDHLLRCSFFADMLEDME